LPPIFHCEPFVTNFPCFWDFLSDSWFLRLSDEILCSFPRALRVFLLQLFSVYLRTFSLCSLHCSRIIEPRGEVSIFICPSHHSGSWGSSFISISVRFFARIISTWIRIFRSIDSLAFRAIGSFPSWQLLSSAQAKSFCLNTRIVAPPCLWPHQQFKLEMTLIQVFSFCAVKSEPMPSWQSLNPWNSSLSQQTIPPILRSVLPQEL